MLYFYCAFSELLAQMVFEKMLKTDIENLLRDVYDRWILRRKQHYYLLAVRKKM